MVRGVFHTGEGVVHRSLCTTDYLAAERRGYGRVLAQGEPHLTTTL